MLNKFHTLCDIYTIVFIPRKRLVSENKKGNERSFPLSWNPDSPTEVIWIFLAKFEEIAEGRWVSFKMPLKHSSFIRP